MHPHTLLPLLPGIARVHAGGLQEQRAGLFQVYGARTDVKYEGQRADDTHAVNGTIHLETGSEDFQCTYNAAGDTLVDFHAEGKSQPTFVKGGGSPHMKR
jgi:hypothetical protein